MISQSSVLKPSALIMAGGTGGHIFPGLAVAKELIGRGWQIHWLGSKGGMEEKLVCQTGITLHSISIQGLRKKGIGGWIKAPLNLAIAIYQASKIIKKVNPEVVIGFGGFASGPGGIASFFFGKTLFLHEQNAIAGLTNKVLSRVSTCSFQAFPNALTNKMSQTIGNPIRKEIKKIDKKQEVNEGQRVNVLVIGGSRGAVVFNEILPEIFSTLLERKKINLVHQCGLNNFEKTNENYLLRNKVANDNLTIMEFIDDMAKQYKWADLVICRAGALTVSEIAAVGIAAIFIPYPYAVDDHQTLNAKWLEKENAAIIIPQSKLPTSEAKQTINALINDVNQLNRLARNAKSVALINATEIMSDACERVLLEAA